MAAIIYNGWQMAKAYQSRRRNNRRYQLWHRKALAGVSGCMAAAGIIIINNGVQYHSVMAAQQWQWRNGYVWRNNVSMASAHIINMAQW